MTKERLQDLAIGFDEYGFEPTTLCDKEAVIEEYRNAFTGMLKDYERFEKLEKFIQEALGIPSIEELKEEKNVNLDLSESAEFRIMFKWWCNKNNMRLKTLKETNAQLEKLLEKPKPKYILFGGARGCNKSIFAKDDDDDNGEEQSND